MIIQYIVSAYPVKRFNALQADQVKYFSLIFHWFVSGLSQIYEYIEIV